MKIQLRHSYKELVNLENLLFAWQEFIVGKKNKLDAQIFNRDLMDNIVELHESLVNHTYCHGGYESFYVTDPKRRHIHKASVRDRLLHHAIYRILYPFFDRTFISDSFSCRDDKGMHRALDRFRAMNFEVSKNHARTCWVLKCDIQKFFDSIDHGILLNILSEHISDRDILNLLKNVIDSYNSETNGVGVGLPLGNLTSQLFSNVYMNVFDQFVKHKLKVKNYIRYADDFVFLSHDKQYLENLIPQIRDFLSEKLRLTLHPRKIYLQTIASGIDFLGWKHFANHRVLRKTTQKRMMRNIEIHPTNETLQSYLGLLKHGNSGKIKNELLIMSWVWRI
ncbi:MAG: reverse transcriptase/maturase family protein [Candidatus Magasanikbacteria bacterium]|jgi:retron-type reverse transcriptase